MRIFCLLLAFSTLCFDQANGALVVSARQDTPGAIFQDSTATISVYIRSDAGLVTNLRGLDFFLNAADAALTGTRTAGGRFVSGTTGNFFPTGSSNYQLPFPTSLAVFTGNSPTDLTVGTTDTLVAQLTLSTTGANEGQFLMGLTNFIAVDAGFNSLAATIATPSFGYTIVAVPEPSSVCLLMVGLSAAVMRRRRKLVD